MYKRGLSFWIFSIMGFRGFHGLLLVLDNLKEIEEKSEVKGRDNNL